MYDCYIKSIQYCNSTDEYNALKILRDTSVPSFMYEVHIHR